MERNGQDILDWFRRHWIVSILILTLCLLAGAFRPNILVGLLKSWQLFGAIVLLYFFYNFGAEIRGFINRLVGGLKLGGMELTLAKIEKSPPEIQEAITKGLGDLLEKWAFSHRLVKIEIEGVNGDAKFTMESSMSTFKKGVDWYQGDIDLTEGAIVKDLDCELKSLTHRISIRDKVISDGDSSASIRTYFDGLNVGDEIKLEISANLVKAFPLEEEYWIHSIGYPEKSVHIKIFFPSDFLIESAWYEVIRSLASFPKEAERREELNVIKDKKTGRQYIFCPIEEARLFRQYKVSWKRNT